MRGIELIEHQRSLMTSVSTGGPRIDEVNQEYKDRQVLIDGVLSKLGVANTTHFTDLWDWYGKWSSGDLPSYQSRRIYLKELFQPILSMLTRISSDKLSIKPDVPTGWTRVEGTIEKMRDHLSSSQYEEDYQQIGLFGREILISLAQAVYNPEKHAPTDGIRLSESDAKGMLEAYIANELPGESNYQLRGHVKTALSLAVGLQHDRTADFRTAALCADGISSLANMIAIISGRRDPEANL